MKQNQARYLSRGALVGTGIATGAALGALAGALWFLIEPVWMFADVRPYLGSPMLAVWTLYLAFGTIVGIGAGLVVAYHWDWQTGSGFVTALGWSLVNFLVLAAILKTATKPGGGSPGLLVALVTLKLIGLYGLAAVILWKRWFPLPAFLGGVTWPLLVVLLRAVSGSLWRRGKTTV